MQQVEPRPLLPMHAHPDQGCPVGRRLHEVLGPALSRAQRAMDPDLARTELSGLVNGLQA